MKKVWHNFGRNWLFLLPHVVLMAAVFSEQTVFSQQAKSSTKVERDIPYADTDNPRQTLDLYLPTKRESERLPVIAFIHGGGWRVGDKGNGRQRTAVAYAGSGKYAAVSIGYRLTGEACWPAQIHDCKAAIRWIHANAQKYGLDARRIGVTGNSAGGHLVAMLGTTNGMKGLEGELGPNTQFRSDVTCVVDFFGPTDLLTMGTWHDHPDSPESSLVGGPLQKTKDVARQASPITHVSKDDVPFLIIHGTTDKVVPFDQSVRFHAALKNVYVETTLITRTGEGHGEPYHNGQSDALVREFFDKHLLGADSPVGK
ncbi:MAG: alpha/beta hydrolase [Planctomycetaceae bacterium]|nr:alpha/beta hydrolase [Planctomycetaceae bacterium]